MTIEALLEDLPVEVDVVKDGVRILLLPCCEDNKFVADGQLLENIINVRP